MSHGRKGKIAEQLQYQTIPDKLESYQTEFGRYPDYRDFGKYIGKSYQAAWNDIQNSIKYGYMPDRLKKLYKVGSPTVKVKNRQAK